MKRSFALSLLLAAGLVCVPAQGQRAEAVIVAAGHSMFYARPGVTAAYSMDTDIVQATAAPGGYRLTGMSAGEATVMLVLVSGVRTIRVTVPAPRMPVNSRGGTQMGAEGQTVEFGQEQFTYNNNPNQITSLQNMTQIAGDRQIHIQIMNADIFPANGETPVGFPMLSYEISRPGQDITLVDEMMGNTDLTMNGILLRGFHLKQGAWEFHAGITSMTQFQDFLLQSSRYEVAGISRHFTLSKRAALEANLYYFNTDTAVNTGATPGPIATLYYQFARNPHEYMTAELGVGQGIAFAGTINRDSKRQLLQASFHYESPHIASLNMTMLHGRMASVNWEWRPSKRLQTELYGDDTSINLSVDQQTIDTATLNQIYWLNPHLGATGGFTLSRFLSVEPAAPTIASAGFVAGPQLLWKHWGGSFSYQKLRNSGNAPDTVAYQAGANVSAGHVNTSVFYNLQDEAPVFAPVQSLQPGLGQVLQYQSEMATTPAQMVAFVHQTLELTSEGYAAAPTVALAARREQYGSNIDWASEKAGHFAFNTLVNTSVGGGVESLRLVTGGVQWTRRFGASNMVTAGFSLYKSTTAGQSTMQPIEQISFQRTLNSVPRFLVPGHRGTITGHVFIDAAFAQVYARGDAPISGVLIYLDGRRTAHTDKSGYFAFHGVPYGIHRIEADYRDARPFYFTSSSPKSVPNNGTADFGISFAQGRIFGSFQNDAGDGLAVNLEVDGRGLSRQVTTSGDGSIEIDGLPPGDYTVNPVSASLPPGYSLANLDAQIVKVTAAQAGHFKFKAQAQRSIAGTVESIDPAHGKLTPVAGVEVKIPELARTAHTDEQGRYLFRQLPAGAATVTLVYQGKIFSHKVLLSSAPDFETGVNFAVPAPRTPKGR